MTVTPTIKPCPAVDRPAEPDVLCSLLKTFVEALMPAEADALGGAPLEAGSEDRVTPRNGYRPRDLGARAQWMELAIPKLRSGF